MVILVFSILEKNMRLLNALNELLWIRIGFKADPAYRIHADRIRICIHNTT